MFIGNPLAPLDKLGFSAKGGNAQSRLGASFGDGGLGDLEGGLGLRENIDEGVVIWVLGLNGAVLWPSL